MGFCFMVTNTPRPRRAQTHSSDTSHQGRRTYGFLQRWLTRLHSSSQLCQARLVALGDGGWLPRTRAFSVRSDNLAIRGAYPPSPPPLP